MTIKCKYCNPDTLFGGKTILKEDGVELFIANDYLKVIKPDITMERSIIIKYCPMCGRKLNPTSSLLI